MSWWRREDVSRSLIFVALAMLAGCRSSAKSDAETAPGPAAVQARPAHAPEIAGCPVFPADNVWNTRIDDLPKDSRSDTYIDAMGVTQRLHADFGPDPKVGIPVTIVHGDTPALKIHFQYDEESDHVAYPIPADVAVEGGREGWGDHHIIVVDARDCTLYEIWHAYPRPQGGWSGGAGMRMDLRSNALRPDTWTSADAAGLAILPGLVRYDEVASGEIRHALRFTLPKTQHAYVWPARHQASSDRNPDQLPMGLRLRLRADFDVSRYPKGDQVILTALKRYGMILADNGSAIFISGSPDRRWDEGDLHELKNVMGQDFEVVDESGLMVDKDSGQAKKTGTRD
jgi:hypothetical protein